MDVEESIVDGTEKVGEKEEKRRFEEDNEGERRREGERRDADGRR